MKNDNLKKHTIESLNALLDYIKVSDSEKNNKIALKDEINNNFELDDLPTYLNKASDLLNCSTNEAKKIQESFLNGIKDNITTLFKILEFNKESNLESSSIDNESTNTIDSLSILEDIKNAVANNDITAILKSVAHITESVNSFKDAKKERANKDIAYMQKAVNYAKKTEERLQQMKIILDQREQELIIDKLTNVYNRRGFEDKKNSYFTAFMKGQDISLVIGDIDDFKKINDTYGHRAGDGALSLIAKILKEQFSGKGDVYRYGGEEFVIIFKGMNKSETVKITQIACDYLAKTHFQHTGLNGKETVRLTMSFGVSQMNKGQTLDETYNEADKLLYDSKKFGKNQVR